MSRKISVSARRHGVALTLSLLSSSLLYSANSHAAPATGTPPPDPASAASTAADVQLGGVSIAAAQFAQARNSLSPTTGSSQYRFDEKTITSLPLGRNTSLNNVLLQAPGVVSDSQGQLHVRGDHANLQYRINGVILPEGITGFGQVLGARIASHINLITGALPAQYGERTAGIIDITTRQNINGGDLDLYGGSFGTVQPSFDYGMTSKGGTTGFLSGSFRRSDLGVEAPTASYNAIHDETVQGKGFGFFATNLTPGLRLSAMAGTSYNRFDLPNEMGLAPDADFVPPGAVVPPSNQLNRRQYERNNFGILALQGLLADHGTWQIAAFNRVSSVDYTPDPSGGDLYYNDGVSARITRKATTWGAQGDLSLPLGADHTLRAGFVATTENDRSNNAATVFRTDTAGDPILSEPPVTVVDNNPSNGNNLEAVYVQDQWNLTDTLVVNYGARFDQLNAEVHTNQLSPRLGMIWYLDARTTFHAGYARYFTPPPNELLPNRSIAKFADTTNAVEVTTNDPVQPERAHYFDIGVTHRLTPAYEIGLDSYYKYARNLLDEGQFGQALIYTPFNYNRGHVYGVELTNAFHHGNWGAYLNVARSMAKGTRVDSGQFNFAQADLDYINNHYVFLDHTQLWTASGGVSWQWRQTTAALDGTYADGLRNDGPDGIPNSGKQPPYVVLNLGLRQQFSLGARHPFALRLTVLNLLDRSYEIHDGTGIGVEAAQYGARRGVFLGLEVPL